MADKVTEALGALGLDPGDVDPDVLAGLRDAASKPPPQLGRDDLQTMTPEQITKAEQEGRLARLLGRETR